MTPEERQQLTLAPGSRWEGDAVVDVWGDNITIHSSTIGSPHPCYISCVASDGENSSPYVADALAAIRAAGLDPEHPELVELRAKHSRLMGAAKLLADVIDKCAMYRDWLVIRPEKIVNEMVALRRELEK